jgi:hypothetical protein
MSEAIKLPPLPPVPEGYARWSKPKLGPIKIPLGTPAAIFHPIRNKWWVANDWRGELSDRYYIAAQGKAKKPKAKKACPEVGTVARRVGMSPIVKLAEWDGDDQARVLVIPFDAVSRKALVEQATTTIDHHGPVAPLVARAVLAVLHPDFSK